ALGEFFLAPRKIAGFRSELVETVDRARVVSLLEDMHLAHPLVGAIAEVLTVVEDERERGRTCELVLCIIQLENSREHRVDRDRAVVEVENEELPAMANGGEAPMRECRLDRMGRAKD